MSSLQSRRVAARPKSSSGPSRACGERMHFVAGACLGEEGVSRPGLDAADAHERARDFLGNGCAWRLSRRGRRRTSPAPNSVPSVWNPDRRGRDGRGLSGARHAARPRRRHQGASGDVAADPDRRERFEREARVDRRAESSAHLHAPRRRPATGGRDLPGHGVPRGRDAGGPAATRAAPARRGADASAIEIADGARHGASRRHRPSRSQAAATSC